MIFLITEGLLGDDSDNNTGAAENSVTADSQNTSDVPMTDKDEVKKDSDEDKPPEEKPKKKRKRRKKDDAPTGEKPKRKRKKKEKKEGEDSEKKKADKFARRNIRFVTSSLKFDQ